MEIIKTELLTKSYDTVKALDGVSLNVTKGEAVALIGVNGSGKTTLINTILGFTKTDGAPYGGESSLLGCESGKLTLKHRQKIGCISDASSPMPWAKLHEIESFFSKIYRKWDQAHFEKNMNLWGLERNRRLTQMSKGQKRLAEFALTLATRPEVLFLDEPFNELDPQHRHDLAVQLSEEREMRKLTLLYSTHALTEIPHIAQRLLMMKAGKLVVDSSIGSLKSSITDTFLFHNAREEA